MEILAIMLYWENRDRFYTATIQRDLFGELCILTTSGRSNARSGTIHSIHCHNIDHAKDILRDIFQRRKAQGFVLFPGQRIFTKPAKRKRRQRKIVDEAQGDLFATCE